jgi:predicted metal-binding membrane protein
MQLKPSLTRAASARNGAAIATLGLAAAAWVLAVAQMNNAGPMNGLGSLAFFAGLWTSMMAAMMLPGAVPAVAERASAPTRLRTLPLFLASYLAVWALVGVVIHELYRAHGTLTSGAVVLAAGVYELTPIKLRFRQRCREHVDSGIRFGLCCVGSSAGLMLVLVAVGFMSVPWMIVITVVVVAQKLLPPKTAVDVPIALGIVALGTLIVLSPSSVPGLTPVM